MNTRRDNVKMHGKTVKITVKYVKKCDIKDAYPLVRSPAGSAGVVRERLRSHAS